MSNMDPMRYALGFDASTQSFSAVLLDFATPKVLASLSVAFAELPQFGCPQGFREGSLPGEVHADPRLWLAAWDVLLTRMKDADWPLSQIAVISGSAQQHGSVYLNARFREIVTRLDPAHDLASQLNGMFSRATAPIWMDRSTSTECQEIGAAFGGDQIVCAASGSIPTERFTGPQIRAFFHRDPDAYHETDRIHLISSFLCSVLSGTDAAIEPGDGAGMNLMSLTTQQWHSDLLEATAPDLAQKLPKIRSSNSLAGRIADYFIQRYGFSPHCQVQLFTGDNPASLVGMGAASPGVVVVSLGTSDTLFEATKEPQTDSLGCYHVFGNPLGGFMTLACVRNGSLAREAFRDQLGVDWKVFEQAGTVELPDDAVTLPFVFDESTPKRKAGIKELRPELRQDQRVRAFLEGQAFNLKSWLTSSPHELRLTGGASNNVGIAQVFADVFGVPVRRLSISSSAALGAAMRAAIAAGAGQKLLEEALCRPESTLTPQNHSACQKRYELWESASH